MADFFQQVAMWAFCIGLFKSIFRYWNYSVSCVNSNLGNIYNKIFEHCEEVCNTSFRGHLNKYEVLRNCQQMAF